MTKSSRKRPVIHTRFTPFFLRVFPSSIARFGVYAAEDIPRGCKVIEYTGERITLREAQRRYRRILRSRGAKRFYLFLLDRRWAVDGAVDGSGAEIINHSCDPNLARRRVRGHILYFSR